MAFASITNPPGQTMSTYRAVAGALGDDQGEGLLVRIVGEDAEGLHVVAVWESKAHHDRFVAERLLPALRRVGDGAGSPASFTELDAADVLVAPAAVPAGR